MTRLIFSVQRRSSTDPTIMASLLHTPQGLQPGEPVALEETINCSHIHDLRSGVVRPYKVQRVGETIRQDLLNAPDIGEWLQRTFRDPTATSIHFVLGAPGSDDYPWEVLYDPQQGFVDAVRWPIGRIKNTTKRPVNLDFAPPTQVLAVLTAPGTEQAQVSARPEWDALYEALEQSGVPYRLHAFVCEQDLLQTINGLGNSRISAEVVDSAQQILGAITQLKPRLVHFFCHGVGGAEPQLLIGRVTDWVARRFGRTKLTPKQIANSDLDGFTWLVTLNCCDSASATKDTSNFAAALVVEGVPAAIGMRQPVRNTDAHAFAGALYSELGLLLASLLAKTQPSPLEFTSAVAIARRAVFQAIQRRDPECTEGECLEWTLPVLYSRIEPIDVKNALPPGIIALLNAVSTVAMCEALNRRLDQLIANGRPEDDFELRLVRGKLQELESRNRP